MSQKEILPTKLFYEITITKLEEKFKMDDKCNCAPIEESLPLMRRNKYMYYYMLFNEHVMMVITHARLRLGPQSYE
jgi:hypothetical protein